MALSELLTSCIQTQPSNICRLSLFRAAPVRRERAELEAESAHQLSSPDAAASDTSNLLAFDGGMIRGDTLEKSMLEDCRSVYEYEKLNRISGECSGFVLPC